jgi:hypothetical protein
MTTNKSRSDTPVEKTGRVSAGRGRFAALRPVPVQLRRVAVFRSFIFNVNTGSGW